MTPPPSLSLSLSLSLSSLSLSLSCLLGLIYLFYDKDPVAEEVPLKQLVNLTQEYIEVCLSVPERDNNCNLQWCQVWVISLNSNKRYYYQDLYTNIANALNNSLN